MAYREVTMLETEEVVRQWLMGFGVKQIARRLSMSRNTVRRYAEAARKCGLDPVQGAAALTTERLREVLEALAAGPPRERGEGWAQCEGHRDFLALKIREDLKLTKVRKLLRRQGVDVSYATLYRFAVAELGFGRKAPTLPVSDGEPGREVQLDTGWMGHLLPDESGVRRRFRAWIFSAACSRHRFAHPCFKETTRDAIEACEAAWAFFGGVFPVVVVDNPKAIVRTADAVRPVFNRTFLEYSQARGFVIDTARVRHPCDKPRVERAVQSTRDDCFAGESLRTIEAARVRAIDWCRTEYGMHRHSGTLRLPLEHFEAEEKARLLPAPESPYEVPLWCEPKVARDQFAQVARALYSLPRSCVGLTLDARADRTVVRFYAGKELVKVHPRMEPGKRSTDPADFPPEQLACASRDLAFIQRQADAHGVAVGQFARAVLDTPLPWTRVRRVYALLGLCRRYGDVRVEEACARGVAAGMNDVLRLKRMLEQATPAPPSDASPARRAIPSCRYLRSPKQYSLPFTAGERPSREQGDPR